MTLQEKSPLAANQAGFQLQLPVANTTCKSKKWRRVLQAFLAGGSFNRFESARQLHDHCLHSTVARIQSMGVTILHEEGSVPGFEGAPTKVCRYSLAPQSVQRALELIRGVS